MAEERIGGGPQRGRARIGVGGEFVLVLVLERLAILTLTRHARRQDGLPSGEATRGGGVRP